MIQPKKHNKHRLLDNLMPIGMVIITLTLIAGCTANYGSLKRDAEVQQAFESNQVPMDYKYYYYADSEPYVVF